MNMITPSLLLARRLAIGAELALGANVTFRSFDLRIHSFCMRRRPYNCLSRDAAFDLMDILHDGTLGNDHYPSRMPARQVDRIFKSQK